MNVIEEYKDGNAKACIVPIFTIIGLYGVIFYKDGKEAGREPFSIRFHELIDPTEWTMVRDYIKSKVKELGQ
jgi:hypothetical protein